jgi:hypothetical protein
MRVSLWWIPQDRIRELSASDLAVLRMCRVLTLFLVAAVVYFTVLISGVGARAERDRLRQQVKSCGCAEVHGSSDHRQ